jgi:nitrogen fixation NifU-like protein
MFKAFHEMLTAEGAVPDEATLGKLTIFSGVREYSSRIKCATLAWHTMSSALEGKASTTTE